MTSPIFPFKTASSVTTGAATLQTGMSIQNIDALIAFFAMNNGAHVASNEDGGAVKGAGETEPGTSTSPGSGAGAHSQTSSSGGGGGRASAGTHGGTNPPPLPGPVIPAIPPADGKNPGIDGQPADPAPGPHGGEMPEAMADAAQRLYDAIHNVQEMEGMIKESEAGNLLAQNAINRERADIEASLSTIQRVETHIGNLQNYIDDARQSIERGSPDSAALEENIAYTSSQMGEFRSRIPLVLHDNDLRRAQIDHWQAEINTRNAEIAALRVNIADQWGIWIQAMGDLEEWGGSSTNLDDDNGDVKPSDHQDGDAGGGAGSGAHHPALFFDAGQTLVIVGSAEPVLIA